MDNDDDRNNNNNNNNNERRQEVEGQQPQPQPRIILLTPEGQTVRSILETKSEELPQFFINKINELMNEIAAAGEFLTKVRTSIVDDLFMKDEQQHRQEQEQQKHGLMKTIVHKDWKKIEKQYKNVFRFFPDVIVERYHGRYPINRMVMKTKDSDYNLRLVSLIPLIVKLGIKLQSFDADKRGGLLTTSIHGNNPLQYIIGYERNEHTTNTTDECFSVVTNQLQEDNLFVKEDIQLYNLGQILFTTKKDGYFLESRFQCLIDMDPMTLSMPCRPENGSWLPIHWSTNNEDIQALSFVLKEGMKYFPEKFGFIFCEGTHRDHLNGKIFRYTPFQRACTKYRQENVMIEIMNHIAEYRSITAASTTNTAAPSTTTDSTTATTTTSTTELSLLLSAVTDETIHIDCLYILMRNDPTAGLLRLQQYFQRQQQLLLLEIGDGDGQTVSKINTDNDTIDSKNHEITGDGTTISSSTSSSTSSSLENVATAAFVSSLTVHKNQKNKNNHNSGDNNKDTHQQSSTKGKKRKQHEMRCDEIIDSK